MLVGLEPRKDIVVSVCLVSEPSRVIEVARMRQIADELSARFRYWEMLVAIPAEEAHLHEGLLTAIANVRLLKIRMGVPFYRRRTAVAQEAIGDVVLLTAPGELSSFDPIALLADCDREGAIVVGRRRKRGVINPALIWLGRLGGFRVDGRDMLTAAYPRTILNQILSHPERHLALRFPPLDDSMPVRWRVSDVADKRERPYAELGRRLGLVQKLVVSSAPRVLTLVSFISIAVMTASIAFGVYAIVVWSTVEDIQPGWFTTSIIQSMTATFLAWAIFGISIGVQKVLETVTNDLSDDVVGERSAVDMFEHVFQDLNVSVESRDATAEATGERTDDGRKEE